MAQHKYCIFDTILFIGLLFKETFSSDLFYYFNGTFDSVGRKWT